MQSPKSFVPFVSLVARFYGKRETGNGKRETGNQKPETRNALAFDTPNAPLAIIRAR